MLGRVSDTSPGRYSTKIAAAAKSLQSCPPIPGILQERTLEWVAISFSNAWKWKVKGKSLSHVWLLATPWTAAYQAPLSMGFPRQEHWSGVPLPSPQWRLGTNSFLCYEHRNTRSQHRLRVILLSSFYRGGNHGRLVSKLQEMVGAKIFPSCWACTQ